MMLHTHFSSHSCSVCPLRTAFNEFPHKGLAAKRPLSRHRTSLLYNTVQVGLPGARDHVPYWLVFPSHCLPAAPWHSYCEIFPKNGPSNAWSVYWKHGFLFFCFCKKSYQFFEGISPPEKAKTYIFLDESVIGNFWRKVWPGQSNIF